MNRVVACLIFIIGAPAFSGPLSPPVGPVAATHKTMTEVEPRTALNTTNTPGDADSVLRITQPGSYYLTDNLEGVTGKSGIEVAASNVVIDLNGFEVVGVAGALAGIANGDFPGFGGITVSNGTVRNWPGGGIIFPLGWTNSSYCRFENVTVRANTGRGIESRQSSVFTGCIAEANTSGFEAGNNAVFTACSAFGNTSDGFLVGFGSTLDSCISRSNLGDGFTTNGGSCAFVGCSSSVNGGDGFDVGSSNLTGCAASFNTGWGFDIGSGSSVSSCSAYPSTATNIGGITASNDCTIRGNNVFGGATGIRVTGSDSRVEGNNVADSTTGVSVTAAGNLIISNSASGGTTRYSILAGNAAGPIVTTANVATNTIPTANFDY